MLPRLYSGCCRDEAACSRRLLCYGDMRIPSGMEKLAMDKLRITIEEVPASARSERDRHANQQFHRNLKWLEAHWADVLLQSRGKFIPVAGQEAFIADTVE